MKREKLRDSDIPYGDVPWPEDDDAGALIIPFSEDQALGAEPWNGSELAPEDSLDINQTPGEDQYGFRLAANIKTKVLRWLVEGLLLETGLQIWTGDSGCGKSTVAIEWMARLSRGEPLIPGAPSPLPANSLFVTGEEAADISTRPRLEAAGADLLRVSIRDCTAGTHIDLVDPRWLESKLEETGAKLVVIDGVFGFIGNKRMNDDSDIRSFMQPLNRIAAKFDCAIVLIRHNAKKRGVSGYAQGLGGVGMTSATRLALTIGQLPNGDPEERFVTSAVSNYGPKPEALVFRLPSVEVQSESGPTEVVKVEWLGRRDVCCTDLTAEAAIPSRSPKTDHAEEFLLSVLVRPLSKKQFTALGKVQGHTTTTLERARVALADRGEIVPMGKGRSHRWVRRDCIPEDMPDAE